MSFSMEMTPITTENVSKFIEDLRKTQEFDWQYLKKNDVLPFDNSIINELKKHSPMFYTSGRQKESIATSVYVSYLGQNYLLTAGHVFDESLKYKDIFIEPGFQLSEIPNGIIYYPKDEKNNFREMDLAIFLIDDTIKPKLDGYFEPFPISEENKKIIKFYAWYFLFGYPVKKNTANQYKAGSVKGNHLCLRVPMKFDAQEIDSFDNKVNIAMCFKPERAILTEKIKDNQMHTVCNLNGMSGCGIWSVPGYPIVTTGMETFSYSLEGLFANYCSKSDALIGFNIHDIIEIIEITTEEFHKGHQRGILKSVAKD